MRSLLPDAVSDLSDADLVARYAYDETALPHLRANMVATLDGAAYGGEGRTASIGTPPDHRAFHVLRGLADVVVAGAGTARAERFGPAEPEAATAAHRSALGQRPAAVVAVVTRSLDLDPSGPLLRDAGDGVLVLAPASAPADRRRAVADRVEVVEVGEQEVDPRRVVDALAERGLRRQLCEGGPWLLTSFLAAGVVDELCLTWTPRLLGGDAARILAGPPLSQPRPDARLLGLLEEGGTLLSRWTVPPQP